MSEQAETFAKHIHDLHSEIRMKINLSNEHYKSIADVHRRLQEFSEGDMVMVRIRPERIPSGKVRKLHAKKMGPFKVLKKISSNAYMLDIPVDFGISNVFNVEDLTPFLENDSFAEPSHTNLAGEPTPFLNPIEPESPKLPLPPSLSTPKKFEQIEEILDDKTTYTRAGSYQKFLVKWKGKPLSKRSWVLKEELFRLNPELYTEYLHHSSPEENSFWSGRDDGDPYAPHVSFTEILTRGRPPDVHNLC